MQGSFKVPKVVRVSERLIAENLPTSNTVLFIYELRTHLCYSLLRNRIATINGPQGVAHS